MVEPSSPAHAPYDSWDFPAREWAVILVQVFGGCGLLLRGMVLSWAHKHRLTDLHGVQWIGHRKRKLQSAVFRIFQNPPDLSPNEKHKHQESRFDAKPFKGEVGSHHRWQAQLEKGQVTNGESTFVHHLRSEANFIKSNRDPGLVGPPPSPMEIEQAYHTRFALYYILTTHHLFNVLAASFGCALLSGAMGSVLAMHSHSGHWLWIDEYGKAWDELFSDYKFFPTFMLVSHLGFYIQRWRGFIFAAWGVEGRLKNISLLIGSDLMDSSCIRSRKLMFKIYRYMVLLMALQYRVVIASLSHFADPKYLMKTLEEMGLITEEEAEVLLPAGTRMRDTVLGWISIEVNNNGPHKTGLLGGCNTLEVVKNVTECRGKMMYFHGNNFFPQPNMLNAIMKFVIDTFILLAVICYPFKTLIPYEAHGSCFQPITIIGVFSLSFAYMGCMSLAYALHAPFLTHYDTFNIDALIAGTEQTVFAYLRASFDDDKRAGEDAPKINNAELRDTGSEKQSTD